MERRCFGSVEAVVSESRVVGILQRWDCGRSFAFEHELQFRPVAGASVVAVMRCARRKIGLSW